MSGLRATDAKAARSLANYNRPHSNSRVPTSRRGVPRKATRVPAATSMADRAGGTRAPEGPCPHTHRQAGTVAGKAVAPTS